MMKIKVILVLVFISSLALSSDYFVTKSLLNLRSEPSTQSEIIGRIPNGDTIRALEKIDDIWIKINYKNGIGYCSKTYLTPLEINHSSVDETTTETDNEYLYGLLGFIFVLIFIILLNFAFYKIGQRHRNKYIAALLALFLGVLGTHRYYLGQKTKGLAFLLSCWTLIPFLVGIWDAITYLFWSKTYFNKKYLVLTKTCQPNKSQQKKSPPKQESQPTVKNSAKEQKVENRTQSQSLLTPPYWQNFKIQSYSDISKANYKQIQFYNHFKKEFKKGSIFPLKNISNYAYLLYYDLLSEFKIHKQELLFEQQINRLARLEPQIRSLANEHFSEVFEQKTKTTNQIKDPTNIESSFNHSSSTNNSQFNKSSDSIIKDESIVDVNNEPLDLSINNKDINQPHAPYWHHTYVYSYDELRYASSEQKKFYKYLKSQVLKGEYVNINGNTNYAFILYFDLLNEYDKHNDIHLLENQFKLIGQICPKTKSYTSSILMDELRKRDDEYSINKLKELDDPYLRFKNGYSDYNPYEYRLGSLYEDKLRLEEKEILWLNKIWHTSNVFLSIEACLIEVIYYYCHVMRELEKTWNSEDITQDIKGIIETNLIRKSDYFESFESDIYLNIFKIVENIVRDRYSHTRKIAENLLEKYSTRVQKKFEEFIGVNIREIIEGQTYKYHDISEQTQIDLNAQNTARWRAEFITLKEDFSKENKEQFIERVKQLEVANQKNPNIENILFEASKFIAKYDKVQSLKYYAQYIYYDLKSVKFDNKELTKTVQKSLFQTEDQINDFKQIIADLIENSDLNTALEKISTIYVPKRKKIKLDITEIKKVEQKHEGTVELLNDFLEAENENTNNSDPEEEIEIVPTKKNESVFISEINLGKIEEELVKLIVENSYVISQTEVDNYAIRNNMFKNQLIDYINETCMEYLDGEALIEEDDDNYVIEESYYQKISK